MNVGNIKYSVYHFRISDFKILTADKNFEQITGYSASDYDGQMLKCTDLVPKTDIVDYLDKLTEVLHKEETQYKEHRLIRKDGSCIVVFALIKSYTNVQNGELQAEVMLTDITNTYLLPAIQEQSYAVIAEHDSLTGLYNRGEFEKRVNNDLVHNQDGMCAMILIDIDNMKIMNSIFGHQAGDIVINLVASILVRLRSKNAILSRMGGDHFGVYLPMADGLSGQGENNLYYKKLTEALQAINIPNFPGINVSLSIGYVRQLRNTTSFVSLYRCSEAALQHAKAKGRSRIEEYSKECTEHSKEKYVLIVSNNEDKLKMIRRIFQTRFKTIEAKTSEKAIECIEQSNQKIAIVLAEIYANGIDGFAVLDYMRTMDYILKVPIVFLSSNYMEDVYKNAFSYGVIDVITEPYDAYSLSSRLNNIIELYHHKNHLEEMTRRQTDKIEKQNAKIIDSLGTVVEFRDMESGAHIRRVKTFTRIIAEQVMRRCPEYELSHWKIKMITEASPLHDIGKIAIPDSILLKPGKLTSEEYEIMKTHTTKGYEIIHKIFDDSEEEYRMYCTSIARYHHEKFDGSGYPEGLSGDDIPLCAQIVSVADAYDALLSKRCYKDAYSYDEASDMIMNGECGKFNPKILSCFREVKQELEKKADELRD